VFLVSTVSGPFLQSFIDSQPFLKWNPSKQMKFPSTHGFESIKLYLKLVNSDENIPSGSQSDNCLTQMATQCKLTKQCRKIENPNEIAFGYSQTHKYDDYFPDSSEIHN
jgi:hypothetical protein